MRPLLKPKCLNHQPQSQSPLEDTQAQTLDWDLYHGAMPVEFREKEFMMKKTMILVCVFAVCAAASVMAMRPPDAASGHLLYDDWDMLHYCVGSPINCDF